MPGMDGLEFLSIVKEKSLFRKIPVILQSGACDAEIQEAISRGADGYLRKPYTYAELYSAINQIELSQDTKINFKG